MSAKQVNVGWFARCADVLKAVEKSKIEGNLMDVLGKSTSVVTGANQGIGKHTVKHLAYLGGTVILACRNLKKANEAIEEIKKSKDCKKFGIKGEDLKLIPMELDLGDLASVEKFAEELTNKTKSGEIPKVRLMVCNAGVLPFKGGVSAQGHEIAFAVNHLGHFYLTTELIKSAKDVFYEGQCRYVVLTSSMTERGPFVTKNVTDEKEMLNIVVGRDGKKDRGGVATYTNTKVCNMHFAQKLQRSEFEGVKITAAMVHPGVVRTEATNGNAVFHFFMKWVIGWSLKTPDQGATTSLYAALMPDESVAAKYFSDCAVSPRKCKMTEGDFSIKAEDLLWKISEDLVREFKEGKTKV